MPKPVLARLALVLSLATLSACGGGGSSPPAPEQPSADPSPPSQPSPQPAADFSLTLSTDRLLLIQGSSAEITATVNRRNGFDGAVLVTLQGLPDGVSAGTVSIAAGATTAPIVLSAAGSAAHSLPTAATARGSSAGLAASAPLTVTVGGAPGTVDTSFGGGAQLVSVAEGEDLATALAVQADGKVVSVGHTSTVAGGTDLALLRHGRDGSLDEGFGQGGKVVTAVGPARAADTAHAVAVQPDGKIVVAGASDAGATGLDFMLVRYNADGSLDAGFGNGGKVVLDIGGSTDRVHALALQADGRIVVGGESYSGTATGVDFALARFNPDGTPDAGFGEGGKVVTPIRAGGGSDVVRALVLQPVGAQTRIVAVGGEGDFVAAGYTPAGALDAGFGSQGIVGGLFQSSIGAAQAALLSSDGKLVLAGHVGHDFAMVRLTADGALDAGFGHAGKVVSALSSGNWDEATAIAQQADGKLLVGGWVYEGNTSNGNFAVQRYAADGALDAGFGNAGTVVTPVAAVGRDAGRALALQGDERVPTVRLLQAGEASDSGYKFGLLRYWL